jgi:hypothetical protein
MSKVEATISAAAAVAANIFNYKYNNINEAYWLLIT